MTKPYKMFSKVKGISLIEIMIALSILSIIMFIGIPGFQSYFERNRAQAVSEGLISAIQMARSEAVVRNQSVELCLREEDDDDQSISCADDGTNWSAGWVLLTNTGDVIRDWRMRGDLSVDTSVTSILFNSRGMLEPEGEIEFRVEGGQAGDRCLRIRRTGMLTSFECP